MQDSSFLPKDRLHKISYTPGQIYNYRFSTKELKEPIQTAATDSGWTYKGVAFGKL